jgi:hypothetical protein
MSSTLSAVAALIVYRRHVPNGLEPGSDRTAM